MRMASSISSVVAMPSFTSQSASRQTASSSRSAIWASISLRRVRGYMPIAAQDVGGALGSGPRSPTSSISGSR